MLDFLRSLLGTDFMPHLYCLRGDPLVLWLEVVSDLAIAVSYYAIPLVLLGVIRQRKEPLFRRVVILFVLFIGACGTTHLLAVWIVWHPMYRLEGLWKSATALISLTTALMLVHFRRQIRLLPTIGELEAEIEERRQAQQAALEKEQRFQNFVDSVQDYAIYAMDAEGVVQTWNHGAERMKGYPAEEVVGRHFSQFYTAEDREAGKPAETLRTAKETGRFEGESWRVRKDGSRFLAHLTLRPLYGEDGALRGFSQVTRDLTETRELETKYQTLLEAMPDAVVIVTGFGTVDFINAQAEKLFGYDRSEVVGQPVEMLVPPRARQTQAGYLDAMFDAPGPPTAPVPPEIFGLRKDGSDFPLEFTVNPLETRDGRMLVFSIRDLTERRKNEARFQTLLETVPDAIVIFNGADQVTYVNRSAEELFGVERGAVLGRDPGLFIPERMREPDRERRRRLFERHGSLPTAMRGEQICMRRDGREFPAEVRLSPLDTPEGPVLLASVRDLSEKQKAEARFRAVLEAAPDAMFMTAASGLILYVNRRAEEMFGAPRERIVGQPADMLIPERFRGERARQRAAYFEAPETIPNGYGGEYLCLRPDGTEFPVEASRSPLETDEGIVLLTAARDISGRKRTEARFQALLEAAPVAIVLYSEQGRIAYVNRRTEALFGYDRAEMLDREADFLVPERMREMRRKSREELFRAIRAEGKAEQGEYLCVDKSGREFYAEGSIAPIEMPEGPMILASIRDLTERKKSEARFQAMLEAAPDAMAIVHRRGTIEFVNAQLERLFGYSREELIGQPASQLEPEWMRANPLVERERLFSHLRRVEIGAGAGLTVMRKDGGEFPAECTLSPIEMEDGWVFLIAIRDATEKRKAEIRFRALLESAPDAILIHGLPDQITYVNRRAERLFGYRREEIVGQCADILFPDHLKDERRRGRARMFQSPHIEDRSMNGEFPCLRKDGSVVDVEISLGPIDTPDGTVLLAFFRDTTERKRIESRFRALLESAPDAMVISGPDGRIELTNLQAERLFGYSREELVGKAVEMLIPPDLRPEYGRDAREFLEGDFRREMGAGLELRARRKDGSEVPVEIRFSPLEGPNGISMTAAIRDITERKKSETRFRALLESAPDAMVIANSQGVIDLANLQTEKLFGYTGAELVGQPVDILVPKSLRAVHEWHRNVYFTSPRQREMGEGMDLMAVRKDGTQFPVEISLSPLEGPSGISVTAAIRDITKRKESAQLLEAKMAELRHSNEQLEQFAHIASHDLQEPLRMVASYTQLLSRRYKARLDSDADAFIEYAVEGTQRMKRLIEDLLLYSRAGRGSPPLKEISSEAALRLALSNLRASIEESQAEVTHGPMPMLVAVESQLVQILQNLIGNAIKYRGSRKPRIHVSAHAGEKEWTFSVADNGIGIEGQYFERIFLIFQRLHNREEYEGTGVGLAICKRILQQQGGNIWVESEPGSGSTFHFTLPVREADAASAPGPPLEPVS